MANTVLIIGNGFDLAHGLPTKYSHFMDFCNAIDRIISADYNNFSWDIVENIKCQINKCTAFNKLLLSYFKKYSEKNNISGDAFIQGEYEIDYETTDKKINEMYDLLKANVWYKYFVALYNSKKIKGENWIDFESEISYIIETIDRFSNNLTQIVKICLANIKEEGKSTYNLRRFCELINPDISIKNLRKVLHCDLNKIVRALEIYLSYFVSTVEIPIISNDISDIKPKYIINFNYTDTYQRIYTHKRIYGNLVEIFHIHGKCNCKRSFEENDMVLGIDEYWPKNERDSHTNFTIFKKFAQRIQKRTGRESYKWIEKIKKEYKECNTVTKVYIFGHSLDVTDKDILFDYLNDDATDVTIFCYDKETEGEYIANVIKIIGEERLLEKVYQDPPKLRFVIQQDMIPIKKDEKELAESGSTTL